MSYGSHSYGSVSYGGSKSFVQAVANYFSKGIRVLYSLGQKSAIIRTMSGWAVNRTRTNVTVTRTASKSVSVLGTNQNKTTL